MQAVSKRQLYNLKSLIRHLLGINLETSILNMVMKFLPQSVAEV